MIKTLLVLAATVLTAVGCNRFKPIDVLNAVTPSDEYMLNENVAYGDLPRQKLDIYTPVENTHNQVIVFVYGGAWRAGSKEEYKFIGEAFAAEGYTVVIPDYRLYPEAVYPAIIDDVADAIKYITANSKPLALPSERFFLMGHSSGAHTAAMIASKKRYSEITPNIKALVGLSGPYDLPMDNDEVLPVFPNIDNVSIVKPITDITAAHPPTLLLHGLDDERVGAFHSERYVKALLENKIEAQYVPLEGVDHTGIIAGVSSQLEFLNETKMDILRFLAKF